VERCDRRSGKAAGLLMCAAVSLCAGEVYGPRVETPRPPPEPQKSFKPMTFEFPEVSEYIRRCASLRCLCGVVVSDVDVAT
jgi:hypothetical protein